MEHMDYIEYTYLTGLLSMLQALLAGVAMGIYYDCFRLLRRWFTFSAFSVAVQDILFWCSAAVGLFFVCLRWNAGFIRVYFVIFALLGWLAYFMTAGRLVFVILDGVKKITRRIFDKFQKSFIKISEEIYQKIR